MFKEIYKRNIDGKIQVWRKEVEGNKHKTLTAKCDLVNGQLVYGKFSESKWKTANPKNVGKKNETSGEAQALLECESEYTKKLKVGYAILLEDVDNVVYNSPMLAKNIEDYKGDLPDYVVSQPKLDGIRAIVRSKDMRTRENDVMTSCPHILNELSGFFANFPDAKLDGELYNHDLKDDFNQIVSLVRSDTDLTQEDYDKTASIIEYHVYDIFMDAPYSERYKFLVDNLSNIKGIKVIRMDIIAKSKINDYLERYLEWGYEGQMIRLSNFVYEEGKRSWSLLKNKIFDTTEFKIKEILPGIGNRHDMAGSIVCYLPDGREFSAGIKGSWEYAKKLLVNKDMYVDGEATIRHFRYTEYGVPRFPVLIEVYEGRRNI